MGRVADLYWVVRRRYALRVTEADEYNRQHQHQDIIEHMKASEKKKLIAVNLVVWAVAILTHPLVQLLPTGSGSPPKIFELLIPLFFMMLAGVSTYLLSAGIGKPKDE